MDKFRLHILEADQVFYDGECESLILPVADGQYGVQAHHVNVVAPVESGELQFKTPDGEVHLAAVSQGIVKVEDNDVLVLVETAERPEDIDINRAKRAAARAKEEILQKRSIREYKDAQAKMARAITRLRLKDRYEAKRGRKH